MSHTTLPSIVTVVSCLLVASCGGGSDESSSTPPESPYDIHTVNPSTVDPGVTSGSENGNDVHIVIPPLKGVTPVNKLFVFLPGTAGVPNLYQLILQTGAKNGFHSFGLDYPNPDAVGGICQDSADANCFYNVRRAVIAGGDDSPDIEVSNSDAIVTRLAKGLAYLNTKYPSEGWGQYLVSGAVDWSRS